MSTANDLLQFGIRVPAGATGDVKTICPNCTPHNRKPKNRNAKDLSVNVESGVWNCWNCGWQGNVPKGKPKKEYVRPVPRLEKVSKKVIEYFEGRAISNYTLLRMGITEATEWMPGLNREATCICFNYYRGEELVNIKFRGPEKSFKLAKDAELIFYNLGALEGEKRCVIVEGEVDCLSMVEAGVFNCVSVPNGASKGAQKLEYLDNCWPYFEGMEDIVIATDDDEAGAALREELGRRLGKTRCRIATYPQGCKDTNEVLMRQGKDAVKELVEGAKPWPIEGIIAMDDMYDEVVDYFLNGYPQGEKAEIWGFDDYLTFQQGLLTTITGIPGSGKDEFVNLICSNLARLKGWHFGVAGFEEPPSVHVTKVMEKMTGRAFSFRQDPAHRMTQSDFEQSIVLVDKYFHYINIDQVEATIDGILAKAEELVKRFGIHGLVINPWNCLDHKIPKGYSETQYISEALTKITNFARRCNVHIFLIAHPVKVPKDKSTGKYEVPTLYQINGSSHFYNKTHNGICVYRDFETGEVTIFIQKVKFYWHGHIGYCSFRFNTDTRQYIPMAA